MANAVRYCNAKSSQVCLGNTFYPHVKQPEFQHWTLPSHTPLSKLGWCPCSTGWVMLDFAKQFFQRSSSNGFEIVRPRPGNPASNSTKTLWILRTPYCSWHMTCLYNKIRCIMNTPWTLPVMPFDIYTHTSRMSGLAVWGSCVEFHDGTRGEQESHVKQPELKHWTLPSHTPVSKLGWCPCSTGWVMLDFAKQFFQRSSSNGFEIVRPRPRESNLKQH